MVVKNSLHGPSIINNLIPQFIVSDSGLIVNKISNIYSKVPTKEHHSIYYSTIVVHIPLSFTGMFSHFKIRSQISYEIENRHEYDVIYLLPETESWNPTNP